LLPFQWRALTVVTPSSAVTPQRGHGLPSPPARLRQYSKNGVVFYTSTVAPTYPFLVVRLHHSI